MSKSKYRLREIFHADFTKGYFLISLYLECLRFHKKMFNKAMRKYTNNFKRQDIKIAFIYVKTFLTLLKWIRVCHPKICHLAY